MYCCRPGAEYFAPVSTLGDARRLLTMLPALLIILFLLLLTYSGLLLYYRYSWLQIPEFNDQDAALNDPDLKNAPRLSVIIPARNEELVIGHCIEALLQQNYPAHLFEIIVVDDHSTDHTAAIVNTFNQPHIKLIDLKDYVADEKNSYKKKAIEVGIAQSNGHLIITTDADCVAGPRWLSTIAAFYSKHQPALIVMPVCMEDCASFIEIFQTLDFMTLQGITGAAVHRGLHSMCNGANLVYSKTAFQQVDGFAGINKIASGDDMLLMHKIYKAFPKGIAYLKSSEVIVRTRPENSIAAFFNQRIRWASKADQYDDKRIFAVLLIVYLFNVGLFILPILALLMPINTMITSWPISISPGVYWLILLAGKTLIELFFLYPVARFFGKRNLLWYFPVMQAFHILYTVVAGWLGKFGSYQWKGRKVQ